MSPRPGGESDKIGNRYEGAWTIRHLLLCLHGHGLSVCVEDVGDEARGAEFTYRRPDGTTEVHQVKRQHGTANNWTVASLHRKGIWADALHHVDQGRQFHFVSLVPAPILQDLCDRARRADSLKRFIDSWLTSNPLREAFDELSAEGIFGAPQRAFEILRGCWFAWHDERDIVQINGMLAGLLLDGAEGPLAALALGDLVLRNLGVELDSNVIGARLAQYGLAPAAAVRSFDLSERVRKLTSNWLAAANLELLQPPIKRRESVQLTDSLLAREIGKTHFLVGTAGSGKSAVLQQVVDNLLGSATPVLAFRLDRLEPFETTEGLGSRLGLPVSPVAALASAAGGGPCVLVVDQLDAVSLVSGRMPENFVAIADLVREASTFPSMNIVLACRRFDVENDYRIRGLSRAAETSLQAVELLSKDEVVNALAEMGLDPSRVNDQQRELLRTPLHLVLLATVAGESETLDFRTITDLFDAFWDRKRRDVRARQIGTRFNAVTSTVAMTMNAQQRLSISATVLDQDDLLNDADVLISEHVLVRDGSQVAFFHESFFDYVFARGWLTQSESLVEFLLGGDQELFCRAQVRQILQYLRAGEPERFINECRAVLFSPQVRFHIKDLIITMLGGLEEPSSNEVEMVLSVLEGQAGVERAIWRRLRTGPWFRRLAESGDIAKWLRGEDEVRRNRAVELLASGARDLPDLAAVTLSQHADDPDYPYWLRWILRVVDVHTSRAVFDLLLDGVRAHDLYGIAGHEIWLVTHGLGEHEPAWALELLDTVLTRRPGAMDVGEDGKVAGLSARESQAADLIGATSASLPKEFLETFLPYMKQVVELTATDSPPPGYPRGTHFSIGYPDSEIGPEIDEAILVAMTCAVQEFGIRDPAGLRPLLQDLAEHPYESSQWLLYNGLRASPATFASWACDILLESVDRLFCGYPSNSVWMTRLLIQDIAPFLDQGRHESIEVAVRDVSFEWERRSRGWYAFTLLSALDEGRLTDVGRRRLGEYRRLFRLEHPPEPEGITGGWIGSPIPDSAIERMTDENWLQAMVRHSRDGTNWESMTGGARQLAQQLRAQTALDPVRFSALAVRLTREMHSAYPSAILMGLGDCKVEHPSRELVFAAVRHIASFEHTENDRWIGFGLQRYHDSAPLDLVELLAQRAVSSSDPVDDRPRIGLGPGLRSGGEDLYMNGINCARGSLAEALGHVLVHDVDGSRTTVVIPYLDQLVADPVLSVRTCVAHVLAGALRHARAEAVGAFERLIETDDLLLATTHVQDLIVYIGNRQSDVVQPVVERMLESQNENVREAGGRLAAFAGLEWGLADLLEAAMEGDGPTRVGVADICARRMRGTTNFAAAADVLMKLFHDRDPEVRKTAAGVAVALRGSRLRPFESLVKGLLASPAYENAGAQLYITLEHAPDRVDDFVSLAARRFTDVYGQDVGDIRTAAAGDAKHVSDLVVRALAQSSERQVRAELLDAVDRLVMSGAYGIEKAIEAQR